jgi:nucleoside-diphosphate-sugar epimerase
LTYQELFVSIDDIARAHVDAALNPSISAGHRYILIGDRKTWAQVVRSMVASEPDLKKHLPLLSDKPTEEEEPRMKFPFEAGRIKRDFGWDCASPSPSSRHPD